MTYNFSMLWYSYLLELQIQFKYTRKRLRSFFDDKFSLGDDWEVVKMTDISCSNCDFEMEFRNILEA